MEHKTTTEDRKIFVKTIKNIILSLIGAIFLNLSFNFFVPPIEELTRPSFFVWFILVFVIKTFIPSIEE